MIPSCDDPMVPKAKAYEEFNNTSVVSEHFALSGGADRAAFSLIMEAM